jgi:hypothetical protein
MDKRTQWERWADKAIGLPLYYCSECQRPVTVKSGEIRKKCNCLAIVNAPRKVFLHGATEKPGWKFQFKVKMHQIASKISGRNV